MIFLNTCFQLIELLFDWVHYQINKKSIYENEIKKLNVMPGLLIYTQNNIDTLRSVGTAIIIGKVLNEIPKLYSENYNTNRQYAQFLLQSYQI